MEDNQTIDPKVIARLKKMLHLAQHGSANEGEANNAAEIAQKIMLENNISMAMVETHTADDGSARKKVKDQGNAKYAFQRDLMAACAEVNFVFQEVNYDWSGTYKKATGYTLIGREANVVAAKILFEYLFQTIDRLAVEFVGNETLAYSIPANSFKEGCSARIGERLRERHRQQLADQAREARERNAAAAHPASTSTALAVVMTDYAQVERDHNEDLRLGKPEGFTANKRLMATRRSEITAALEDAFRPLQETVGERDVLMQAAQAAFAALCGNRQWTIDEELMKVYDSEVERCIRYHMDVHNEKVRWAKMTPLQRQREVEKEQRASDRYWNAYYRRQGSRRAAPSGVDRAAYDAGQATGSTVGLDAQVDAETRKAIK